MLHNDAMETGQWPKGLKSYRITIINWLMVPKWKQVPKWTQSTCLAPLHQIFCNVHEPMQKQRVEQKKKKIHWRAKHARRKSSRSHNHKPQHPRNVLADPGNTCCNRPRIHFPTYICSYARGSFLCAVLPNSLRGLMPVAEIIQNVNASKP